MYRIEYQTSDGRAYAVEGGKEAVAEHMAEERDRIVGNVRILGSSMYEPIVIKNAGSVEEPLIIPDCAGQAGISPDPAFGSGVDEEPLLTPWESAARNNEDDGGPLTPQFVVSDADVSDDDDGPLLAPSVLS